jgi:hypothetical protein
MVFVVTAGIYDDFHIIGAYTRIGDARRAFRQHYAEDIECWEGSEMVRSLNCRKPEKYNRCEILERFEPIETPFGTFMVHKSLDADMLPQPKEKDENRNL